MSKILFAVVTLFAVSAHADGGVVTKTLNPFNSINTLPSDATGLYVDQVKYIQVATERTLDYTTCGSPSDDDSGPSETCPTVTDGKYVSAIEIHYWFTSQSLATNQDNGSPSYEDTFVIDPSTLSDSQLAEVPTTGALKGKAAVAVTTLASVSKQVPVQEIDDAKTVWCAVTYNNDGPAVKVDPSCVDQIAYKTVETTVLDAEGSLK